MIVIPAIAPAYDVKRCGVCIKGIGRSNNRLWSGRASGIQKARFTTHHGTKLELGSPGTVQPPVRGKTDVKTIMMTMNSR